MKEARMKRLFYFSVAVLLAIMLVWVGVRLLLLNGNEISDTFYTVTGLLLLLGGILTAADIGFTKLWWISGLVVLLGLYSLARGWSAISSPLLAHFMGVASLAAALILLYIARPGRRPKSGAVDAKPET